MSPVGLAGGPASDPAAMLKMERRAGHDDGQALTMTIATNGHHEHEHDASHDVDPAVLKRPNLALWVNKDHQCVCAF